MKRTSTWGRHWRGRGAVWLRRYLPAEIVATVCTILGGVIATLVFANPLLTALAGTWGENLGYYSTIAVTEFRRQRALAGHARAGSVLAVRTVRNLLLEFTGAELLDSFLLRPAAMYGAIALTGSLPLGLLLGKLAADVAFYLPTIVAYELRQRYLPDRTPGTPPADPARDRPR